jgi:hypothetical protein
MGIMIQKKTTGMPNEDRNEQRKKPSRIDYDPPKNTGMPNGNMYRIIE